MSTINYTLSSVIHILEDMKVEVNDSSSKAHDTTNSISSNCQMKVTKQIKANTAMNPIDVIDSFVSCAQPLVANQIEEVNKEIKEQASLRTVMAGNWEDYTCADFDLPTTTPEKMSNWDYRGKEHVVGVLLDRDSAKIHYVKVSWQRDSNVTSLFRSLDAQFTQSNFFYLFCVFRTSLLQKSALPLKLLLHHIYTVPLLPMEQEAVKSLNRERHCKQASRFHGTRRRRAIRSQQCQDVSTRTSMMPLDMTFKRLVKKT